MIVGISKTKPVIVKFSTLNVFFSLQDEEWKKKCIFWKQSPIFYCRSTRGFAYLLLIWVHKRQWFSKKRKLHNTAMKKSAMQIIRTGVMSIMRHCMQIPSTDQMLLQQHELKSQLKNSYTCGIFFPWQDSQEQPVTAAGRKSLSLGEVSIQLDRRAFGYRLRPGLGSWELYLWKGKVWIWF